MDVIGNGRAKRITKAIVCFQQLQLVSRPITAIVVPAAIQSPFDFQDELMTAELGTIAGSQVASWGVNGYTMSIREKIISVSS